MTRHSGGRRNQTRTHMHASTRTASHSGLTEKAAQACETAAHPGPPCSWGGGRGQRRSDIRKESHSRCHADKLGLQVRGGTCKGSAGLTGGDPGPGTRDLAAPHGALDACGFSLSPVPGFPSSGPGWAYTDARLCSPFSPITWPCPWRAGGLRAGPVWTWWASHTRHHHTGALRRTCGQLPPVAPQRTVFLSVLPVPVSHCHKM